MFRSRSLDSVHGGNLVSPSFMAFAAPLRPRRIPANAREVPPVSLRRPMSTDSVPASRERPKAWLAWSSGKDSAWALHAVRSSGELDVVALLTTINQKHARVAMHAVRETLVEMQAEQAELALVKVAIPSPCPNEIYEEAMSQAMRRAREDGITHVVFGDLFLEDIRAYRERQLAMCGITPVFPLWGRDTRRLAEEMIAGGLAAHLTCVDPRKLGREFAGRRFDSNLLEAFPTRVDPCGENGEFHTFASAGPMFRKPIPVVPGEIVERDGFVFADLLPRTAAAGAA
jgi:uncharacterized protein (TIGR00290 family)